VSFFVPTYNKKANTKYPFYSLNPYYSRLTPKNLSFDLRKDNKTVYRFIF